jgi:5-methylcytosine-specific restriction endonuclease McrA
MAYYFDVSGNRLVERGDAYAEYLATPRWRAIRQAMLWLAGYRCGVCNASREEIALEVHHRDYARVGAERPDDLLVLCTECHDLFHRYGRLVR